MTDQKRTAQPERHPLTRVEGKEFVGQDVILDGIEYVRCKFIHCTLLYSGMAGIGLLECEYDTVRWQFSGTAAVTAMLMQTISTMGDEGRDVIAAMFPALTTPARPKSRGF